MEGLGESCSPCFLSPVCAVASQQTDIVVFSVKLGLALSPSRTQTLSNSKVAVLLVCKDLLVHQAYCSVQNHAVLRFTVPAGVLQPSLITVYVALSDEHGRLTRVVDSGQLLVLPEDAATEVQDLFVTTTVRVQKLLHSSGSAADSNSRQQQRPPWYSTVLPSEFSSLLSRLSWRRRRGTIANTNGSSSRGSSCAAGTSRFWCSAAGAADSSNQDVQPDRETGPDACTLYAYEHVFVPFLQQWCLHSSHTEDNFLWSSNVLSNTDVVPSRVIALLDTLLEHELWACSMLILGKFPTLAAQVQHAGLKPGDGSRHPVLSGLPKVHQQGHMQQAYQSQLPLQTSTEHKWFLHGALPQQLPPTRGQQDLHRHHPQQQHAWQQQVLQGMWLTPDELPQTLPQQAGDPTRHSQCVQQQHLQQFLHQSNMLQPTMLPSAQVLPPPVACAVGSLAGSDDSVESASEILVRLGRLQQARGEQEALAALEDSSMLQREHAGSQRSHTSPALLAGVPTAGCSAPSNPQGMAGMQLVSVSTPMQAVAAAAPTQAVAGACCQHYQAGTVSQHMDSSIDAALQPPAESTGLRQRRRDARDGIMLRKLSWEEEQPEPVPLALPLTVQRCETESPGWYPGCWHLPGPCHSALPANAYACAVQAPPPVALPMVQMYGYAEPASVNNPYSEPMFEYESHNCTPQPQQQNLQTVGLPQEVDHRCQQEQQEQNDCQPAKLQWSESAASSPQQGIGQMRMHPLAHGDCSTLSQHPGKPSGSRGAEMGSKTHSSDTCSRSVVSSVPASGLSWQHPWQLAQLCSTGFQDSNLEASYLVFKNHGCSMLDTTAGFICTAMLMTSTMRSFWLASDSSTLTQLITLFIYWVFFFLPYIMMQLHVYTFLRNREQLLVFGRNISALVLCAMVLGYLPVVQVWKNVVSNTLSLQIQNGFILPACQQVRLPAAALIALVHVPADAVLLSLGKPFNLALLHSTLMQVTALLVTVALDAWCRCRFVQQYSGAVRSAAFTGHAM